MVGPPAEQEHPVPRTGRALDAGGVGHQAAGGEEGGMTDPAGPNFIKATDLLAKDMPALHWAVPGIWPQGLALLSGKPKIGKTFFITNLGIASASGGRALGQIPVEARDTLMLLLEDTPRRVRSRLIAQLGDEPCPTRLSIATTWPRLDQGGETWLDAWGKKHPGSRVFIDTLARVRPGASRNGTLYADDYGALAGIQTIAGRHDLEVMVVHHTRKLTADDPLETVSGTQGLTGAADTVLVLQRDRARRDATLFVTGRDVEEAEISLRWEPGSCSWSLLGQAISEEREAVIRLLRHAGKPVGIKELALGTGRTPESVRVLCWRMANAGQIMAAGKGLYSVIPVTAVMPVTGVMAVTDSLQPLPGVQG
jgi:hypothetical protein